MVFALGFMIAGLIALAIAPAFWSRAVRLSRRRIEMQIPASAREILAERDLIRAEFAVERRKLEQKVEAMGRARAHDLAEIGRGTAAIAGQKQELAALDQRNAEQSAEAAALQRQLSESAAELAATQTALYEAGGLVERKDAELLAVRADFSSLRSYSDSQRAAAAALNDELVKLKRKLDAQSTELARFQQEIASMRLEHDADLATLKATAAKLADREEALRAAEKREADLERRRVLQVETTRAVEKRNLEKIDRLRAAEAAAQIALAAARANSDSLTLEVAALRAAGGGEAAPASAIREENAILRQKINEIGAAVIRMANGCAPAGLDEAPAEADGPDASQERSAGRAVANARGAASSN